jgi:uncharacterized protein
MNEHQRAWVLLSSKTGDNVQSLALAASTAVPFESRKLVFKSTAENSKPHVSPTLAFLDLQNSDPLRPPWPNLVITTGRRPSSVALWIKTQSRSSARIVLIGKPKGRNSEFDLVIAPKHYKFSGNPSNVLQIGLPLLKVSSEALGNAERLWRPPLDALAKPITVLCFGGSMGARDLDGHDAAQIIATSKTVASCGTLYVVTSRRTSVEALLAIETHLPTNGILYKWQANDPQNPYLGLLACGDRFIVTGDSISMLVEIARLGKPLAIASLPKVSWAARTKDFLSKLGAGASRDFDLLHRYLIENSWAVPLGQPFNAPVHLPMDDTQTAANRVRALLGLGPVA